MIHKHSITKNILDATPVILGAAASTDMVTFAYGTLKKALERTSGHSGEIEFGHDEATAGGQILVGGTPVTSKILDVDAADKANASTGVQTVTVTYVDSTQSEGKNTKTFEVISDAVVKSYITNAKAELISDGTDASTDDTINGAKKYAEAAGWLLVYDDDEANQHANPVIQLKDKNGTVLSTIDANDFIKDGMLKNAELVTTKPSQATDDTTGPWLVLTWNTDGGDKIIAITLKSLVDTYTTDRTDQLSISGYKINPITVDPAELTTGTLDSSALATAGQVKAYVDATVASKNVSATGDAGANALVSASAANNDVTVSSTTKLQTAVGLAETAVQTISEGSSSEGYVALTVGTKTDRSVAISINDAALVTKINEMDVSINNNNASIVSLNTSVNVLEDALNDVSVTAIGDTLISAAQDGTNHMKINVGATADLTTAVANANSALHGGAVGTNATDYLTNTRATNTSTLTVDFAAAPINTSTGVNALTGTAGSNQFVTVKAIKEYVDSNTSAALSWIMLTN